ncbi:MAG: vitamin K epoxide reductase family protein [Candidatus Levyibacteriota bacterium]|jgi:uncharacterized membrane protein
MQHFLNNRLIFYSAILAFLGFLDSLYLTISHYKNIVPPCTLHGCEAVLTSSFSTIGPIPLALFGVLFYLAVIIICVLIVTEKKNELLKFFHFAVLVGFLFSVVLFLIQLLILKSFCQYCLLSEVIATGLLILSFLQLRENKKNI